jgi:hypothetical protein
VEINRNEKEGIRADNKNQKFYKKLIVSLMYSIALNGNKDLHENTYTNCRRDRTSYWEYTKRCEKQFPFSASSY